MVREQLGLGGQVFLDLAVAVNGFGMQVVSLIVLGDLLVGGSGGGVAAARGMGDCVGLGWLGWGEGLQPRAPHSCYSTPCAPPPPPPLRTLVL